MDYKTENLWLMKGDCLERMKEIPDKSVDMVLTDPPYGTTACKWDSVIPFDKMWPHLKRIIKDHKAIVLFGSEPFSSALRISNLKDFKYDWVWKKGKETCGGFIQARNKPIQSHELISCFSNGKTFHEGRTNKRMPYYPQGLLPHGKPVKGAVKLKNLRTVLDQKTPNDYVREFTNYPSSILEFKSSLKNRLHPTQKPVALLEYLIKTYTLENETVLDFTMGSGSTGVACKNLSRKFIGIERDDDYFHIAQKRILDIKPF